MPVCSMNARASVDEWQCYRGLQKQAVASVWPIIPGKLDYARHEVREVESIYCQGFTKRVQFDLMSSF